MSTILTDEQTMLVESVRRFLEDKATGHARGQSLGTAAVRSLWSECTQMGWLQVCVPEAQSGLGLGVLDAALMAEEMGRHLLAVPVSPAMAIAALLSTCPLDNHENGDWPARWLQGDEYLAMVASESSSGNNWAEYAIDACQALAVHWDDGRVRLSRYGITDLGHGIDPLLATAKVADGLSAWTASGACSAESWRVFCQQQRVLRLAELIGAASKALEEAAAYAREREQFGKSIGVNQAIKHRLADNWMAIDNARLALHDACAMIDEGQNARLPLLMAELLAIEASASATAQAIQTFGAMGITWECQTHFYLKRVKHIVAMLRSKHDTAEILDQVWEMA